MYQGGARDAGITPILDQHDGAYEQTPAPKYFVELEGAGHFAWTDARATAKHPTIVEYGEAFFDCYLKGRPFPKSLEEPHPGLADLRFQQ